MRALALCLALLALVPASIATYAAEAFVTGTEDVPLMPGLAIVDGAGVVFDTPQGRIVEAYAKGKAQRDAVLDFYAATLPQLGWQALSRTSYRREGEILRLELYEEGGGLTLRFYLSPS
ncbi:MAG TPA: hypothetical protein VEK12_18910 [Alphaproteobacteria bacterium]|nr:hypothetical protein [Alphaproteobacteria bacterium]